MRFFFRVMERGMKSDTTEMVLLGAAAAVIALVVAFSMMDDKGSKKRSLEEMADDAGEEAGADATELKQAVEEAKPLLSKISKLAGDAKAKVEPGSRSERLLNTVQNGAGKASEVVSAAGAIIPEEVKDNVRARVREVGRELGGRALSYVREAAGRSFEQNKPKEGIFGSIFSKPKETPLPPGMGGSREVRL
jgi:hypothetical protein